MYLRSHGASVSDTEDADRASLRARMGIPDSVASCHTALVAGYVVEGHVPAPALRRLLDEGPDVVGLALPGMPGDSPGMGGDETTWAAQDVLAVMADGRLSRFGY
ncbi:MAG: hypothetical protein RI958_2466 [Actinomycetota bacterium]